MKGDYKTVEEMLIAVADKVQQKCEWVKAEPVTVYGNKRQWIVVESMRFDDDTSEYSSTDTMNSIMESLVRRLDSMFPDTVHEARFSVCACSDRYRIRVRTTKKKAMRQPSPASIREFVQALIHVHPKLA
jgi:hypothetical protein